MYLCLCVVVVVVVIMVVIVDVVVYIANMTGKATKQKKDYLETDIRMLTINR